MQKVILALLALCASGWGAIGALTIPHEIDSAAIPKVIYIDQNNDSIINKVNQIKDTVNGLAAGTAAFSGLTASSLVSTNASKQLTSTIPSAVTFPGTVNSTGLITAAGGVSYTGGTNAVGSIFLDASRGLALRGVTGSTDDFSIRSADGTLILRNPTGTTGITLPTAIAASSTLAVTGKVTGSDTVAAALGFRAGSAGATDAQLYRSAANMWTTPDSLTVAGRVAVSGAAVITGTLTADSLISSKFYTEGSFTIAGTGFSACSQGVLSGSTCTATAYYVRVGKAVTLYIPYLAGTSNATTFTLTGIPAAIRPARAQNVQASTIGDNSSGDNAGSLDILTDGTAVIYRRTSTSAQVSVWTASNTKTFYYNTVQYTLQ